MKKVHVKGKKEEKKREKVILGVIIAFIMISSVLGYFGSESGQSVYKYNGIKFTQENNGLFSAKIGGQGFRFNYLPQGLANMSFDISAIEPLKQTKLVYTTSDYKSQIIQSLSETEYLLSQELVKMKVYAIGGYTTNTSTGRPKITCANATAFVPVILFEYSNQSKVSLDGQCIHVAASNRFDLLALKDRILFSLLGILK